jgi:hypothetical protein
MGRYVLTGVVVALAAGCGGRPEESAGDDARTVIEKAVKAQGGEEKLARLRAGRWKGRGAVTVNGQAVPMTVETVFQMPDRFKMVQQIEVQGRMIGVTQVVAGGTGWMSTQGTVQNLTGDMLEALKEEMYAANVEMLVPLLREPGYTLSTIGGTNVEGRPTVGVTVAANGHEDIELYFDRETAMPVKTLRPMLGVDTMKATPSMVFYSDVREFDGVKMPAKMEVYQGGKKVMAVKVTSLQRLDKIDPGEFVRPR